MKYSELKRKILMTMGEYSANGSTISTLQNKDYLLAMTDATNESMTEIVTIGKSKYKEFDISQRNPKNGLGHLWKDYTLENGVATFELTSGRMYSLEVSMTCVIYIEEYTGTWNTLETINHANAPGQGYVNYKGSPTKADNSNPLRIRITSNFDMPYRWVALWTENLEDVPTYQPYIEYDMPTDLYQIDRVNLMADDGDYYEYPDKMYTQSGKKLSLRYEEEGEFRVTYFAYPTLLTVDVDNVDIADNEDVDVIDEYIPGLINSVAGKLKANIDKKFGIGDRFSGIGIDSVNSVISDQQKKSIARPIKGSRRSYAYPKTKNCYKHTI